MPTLRRLVRIPLLLAVTAVGFVALWLVLLLLLPVPRLRRRGRNVVFRRWSRACLRVLGGRLEIVGRAPAAPFFLVSNHVSYLDVLVLAACLDAYFVAKLEVRAWPLFGVLCRSVGTIFIDRKLRRDVVRVNRLIADVLERGYGVILFPEGTSTQGYQVDRFRAPLLEYAARDDMPVHVAAIHYETPPDQVPAHLAICWWGDAPFLAHAWQLLGLRAFRATLVFGDEPVSDGDRKQLAERLRAAVSEIFRPVVPYGERARETGF